MFSSCTVELASGLSFIEVDLCTYEKRVHSLSLSLHVCMCVFMCVLCVCLCLLGRRRVCLFVYFVFACVFYRRVTQGHSGAQAARFLGEGPRDLRLGRRRLRLHQVAMPEEVSF